MRHKLSQLDDGDQVGLAATRDAITLEDYETIFTGRSEADFNDPADYQQIVGDFENAIFSEDLLEDPKIGAKVPGIFCITSEFCFHLHSGATRRGLRIPKQPRQSAVGPIETKKRGD